MAVDALPADRPSRSKRLLRKAKRPSVSIAVALVVAVAVLLSVNVGVVLYLGYRAAQLNTAELVSNSSVAMIKSVVDRTRSHLDPVQAQLEFLAKLIERERIDLDRPEKLGNWLLASLAAVPQETVVAFANADFQVMRAFRNRPNTAIRISDWRDDPDFAKVMARAARADRPFWGELFVAAGRELPFINLFVPIRQNGTFVGTLIAGVAVEDLSEFLDSVTSEQFSHPFILYGRDAVLAHPLLRRGFDGLTDQHPLPSLKQVGDPVLQQIWTPDSQKRLEDVPQFQNRSVDFRVVDYHGHTYLFSLKELPNYGDRPWIVGSYLPLEQAVPQLNRLNNLLWVGSSVLLVGLILALLIGRRLGRPIRELAEEANRLRDLNFDTKPRRIRGPFRELNEASRAFDAMVDGLRLFATYVPRSLVRRLIRHGRPQAILSEEREVTVMFTDISGFTSLSEQMPASEVATFLNEHFTIVDACVEATEGTIDKYIGDAVMAFWGAPGAQPDHAALACRAAAAVGVALTKDNEQRAKVGQPAVRMRIGIHSGRALVGDIGAPSRVNYTVVGDVVNVAERLEELARTAIEDEDDVSILVSSATAAEVEGEFSLVPFGAHVLRGRSEPLDVFQLVPNAAAQPTPAANLSASRPYA